MLPRLRLPWSRDGVTGSYFHLKRKKERKNSSNVRSGLGCTLSFIGTLTSLEMKKFIHVIRSKVNLLKEMLLHNLTLPLLCLCVFFQSVLQQSKAFNSSLVVLALAMNHEDSRGEALIYSLLILFAHIYNLLLLYVSPPADFLASFYSLSSLSLSCLSFVISSPHRLNFHPSDFFNISLSFLITNHNALPF